jgi:thiamine phosphate synthase YjbQ (UPF0047 family)
MDATLSAHRLELRPTRRPEAFDLRREIARRWDTDAFVGARRLLCISHHTTAGFLDRRLRARLGGDPARLSGFLEALGGVFPPGAGYQHDRLHLRDELSPAQREREPLNADAHLAFIGGGFTNCTLVDARDEEPLWFVDLDGVFPDRNGNPVHRIRTATVVGFAEEDVVTRIRIPVEVGPGAAVVRLDDPKLALLDQVTEALAREDVQTGRLRLRLDDPTPDAGVTVNEFEALLMEQDVARVLSNPLDFAASAVKAVSGLLEAVRITPDRLPRLLQRVLARPVPRVLRMQRELSLGILPESGRGALVLGTYQSPILVQREGAPAGTRMLVASIRRFR